MGSLVCPCCCCCCYSRAPSETSALGDVVQLKSVAIATEERPVWRLHWTAFSSQREWVWQLTVFAARKRISGLNRIGHPDWVKLSVELNCAPNQNTKFPFHYKFMSVFTKIDLKTAYHQIQKDDNFKEVTTINTPIGLLKWRRMLYGIKTASAIFQRAIEQVLEDIKIWFVTKTEPLMKMN